MGFGVLAAEAEAHEVGGGERAGTLGREGSFAVEGVVGIDGAAFAVGGDRDAAAEVAHDEVEVFVPTPYAAGIAAGDGALVEGMPDADAVHEGRAAHAGFVFQFVHHAGVGDIGGATCFFGNHIGDDAAEVASVLARGGVSFVAHLFVHEIHAARYGLEQSAAPYDGIKLQGDIRFA